MTVAHARFLCASMEDFLSLGGPDAIRGLRATIARLEGTIQELRSNAKLQRYSQLQAQLAESDKVKAALTAMLVDSFGVDDAALQAHIKQTVAHYAVDKLYGASRELLLRENKLLRAQLEQRVITEKTSWRRYGLQGLAGNAAEAVAAAGAGPGSGSDRGGGKDQDSTGPGGKCGRALKGSRLDKARVTAGPQVEALQQLLVSAEELQRAECGYRLPDVRNACVQADDGSLKTISILQGQVSELAGQKSNLLAKVAELQQDQVLLEKRLEQALHEAAEQRRQRTELLLHREELSKDLRNTLESEAKRADAAELALGEARVRLGRQDHELSAMRDKLAQAAAQLAALEAALEEKMKQLNDMRGLYQQLYTQLDKVELHHEDMSQAVIDAIRTHHQQQTDAMREAQSAAQESVRQAAAVAGLQRRLQEEVSSHKAMSDAALAALEGELQHARTALQGEQYERRAEARKAMAALLLTKAEDRRHERTLKALATDLPAAVAENLSVPLGGIQHTVGGIADDVALANRQLSYLADGGVAASQQLQDNDLQDDQTGRLLGQSRGLRAQLQALAAGDPTALVSIPEYQQQQRQMDMSAAVGNTVLDLYHEQNPDAAAAGSPRPAVSRDTAAAIGASAMECLREGKERRQAAVGVAVVQAYGGEDGARELPRGQAVAIGAAAIEELEVGRRQREVEVIGDAVVGGYGGGGWEGEVPRDQAFAIGAAALETLQQQAVERPLEVIGDAVVGLLEASSGGGVGTQEGEGPGGRRLTREQAVAVGRVTLESLQEQQVMLQVEGQQRRGLVWPERGRAGASAGGARAGSSAEARAVSTAWQQGGDGFVAVGDAVIDVLEDQNPLEEAAEQGQQRARPKRVPRRQAAAIGVATLDQLGGVRQGRPMQQQGQGLSTRQEAAMQQVQAPTVQEAAAARERERRRLQAIGVSTVEALESVHHPHLHHPHLQPYVPRPGPAVAAAIGSAVEQDLRDPRRRRAGALASAGQAVQVEQAVQQGPGYQQQQWQRGGAGAPQESLPQRHGGQHQGGGGYDAVVAPTLWDPTREGDGYSAGASRGPRAWDPQEHAKSLREHLDALLDRQEGRAEHRQWREEQQLQQQLGQQEGREQGRGRRLTPEQERRAADEEEEAQRRLDEDLRRQEAFRSRVAFPTTTAAAQDPQQRVVRVYPGEIGRPQPAPGQQAQQGEQGEQAQQAQQGERQTVQSAGVAVGVARQPSGQQAAVAEPVGPGRSAEAADTAASARVPAEPVAAAAAQAASLSLPLPQGARPPQSQQQLSASAVAEGVEGDRPVTPPWGVAYTRGVMPTPSPRKLPSFRKR